MSTQIFKRYEKKYMLSRSQYEGLLRQFANYMAADQYGRHSILSLYLDTENYDMIRQSIEKPVYKEKIRIRSYGEPKTGKPLFLEVKKKYDGIVYKRRVAMELDELANYMDTYQQIPHLAGQIMDEIDYTIRRYNPLPKVLIAYERTAYAGLLDPALRITFDERIRYRDFDLDLASGSYGRPLIHEGQVLMEIKTTAAMPLWLVEALNDLHIMPSSFSKYGTCYEKHLLPHLLERKWSA